MQSNIIPKRNPVQNRSSIFSSNVKKMHQWWFICLEKYFLTIEPFVKKLIMVTVLHKILFVQFLIPLENEIYFI